MLITMPPVGAAPARDWVPQRLWECLLLWERPLAATWGHSPCGSGPWPRLGATALVGAAPGRDWGICRAQGALPQQPKPKPLWGAGSCGSGPWPRLGICRAQGALPQGIPRLAVICRAQGALPQGIPRLELPCRAQGALPQGIPRLGVPCRAQGARPHHPKLQLLWGWQPPSRRSGPCGPDRCYTPFAGTSPGVIPRASGCPLLVAVVVGRLGRTLLETHSQRLPQCG